MYQQFGDGLVLEDDRPVQASEEAKMAAERIKALSAGQLEVLRLVDQHLSSKEIATLLGISSHTVDQRIRTAIRLLGVSRRQDAARLVALAEPYQRLIHQAPYIDPTPGPRHQDGAISFQIRHADRAVGIGDDEVLETEQGATQPRSSLVLPWSTRNNPRNQMSVGQRLLWVLAIAMGASFSAGMYLAGLESLARLVAR
ncbi:helix-turn-helix transcriptional regulator [Sphingomonas sp. KRR8]|uniref:helix-turn-helix domain-containing protein n=1 Tax=Sphingomonas sp. KRR8 TaxID=2942996 RepID=UPI002020AF5C|nr:helix-turn-helix transcriptional regulator [Sphingomonas sp. KRR8]URD59759.1 helix-turn-helix transcriptional regulator [Sphingomonas sp. KRR8]